MPAIRVPNAIIDVGGPTRRIKVGERVWMFEDHDMFGPVPISAKGSEIPGTARFWEAVTVWGYQGKRVGEDGLCLWDVPPDPPFVHVSGRQYVDARTAPTGALAAFASQGHPLGGCARCKGLVGRLGLQEFIEAESHKRAVAWLAEEAPRG